MEPDWTKCIICQQETSEPLKCPLQGPGTNEAKIEVNEAFLENIKQFRAIGALLTTIHFESNDTVAAFSAHCTSWHKSCHLK